MPDDSFVHLHVHTEYSMLDGAAKMKALFGEASRLGMPAVSMTDHGNMFGAHEFWTTSQGTGVKPIVGIEAYLAPGSRFHKKPVFWGTSGQRGTDEFGEGGDVSGAGAYTHMTMVARNATGLRNLFKLSSLASMEGAYRKPRMDKDLISELAEGIIATTGCPSGEVQTRLRLGQPQEALAAAAEYRDIFGADNFFLELMDHGLPIERSVREGLLTIAKQLNLRPLATNDSHYVTKDQAEAHSALLCVQSNKTLSDPTRFKFDGDGYYLKSAEEMRSYWDTEVPGAADNTLLVAEMVESYAEVFEPKNRMPQAKIVPGKTDEQVLREEIEHFIPTRFPDGMSQKYRDQLDWELDVIIGKGYASYFLVVGDLVRWAKNNGIRVGPGRGSAAGALLSYILHIIDIDPLQHGLIFERFLNPERESPPDIDIDFDERRRDEVIAYAKDKYGEEYFAKVITYGTIKTKAAFKDAARVHLGQAGFSVADRFSKALPPPVAAKDIPLSGIVDPEHERYAEAAEVRTLIETDPEVKKIYDTARGLEGLIRNAGVHACAHIISREPLLDVLPLWQREDGAIITGWDGPQCEAVGLLKIDILGLVNMTTIDDTARMVKANHGVEIDTLALPMDDKPTFEMLGRGETLGVFQLEGGGMQALLKRMQPTTFEDIVACVALYRPGPMDVDAHLHYADRKNGRQKVAPIHPELEEPLAEILSETYGLIVYQEQIMQIAQKVAGYSLGQADTLRRAMGKKKKEVLEREFAAFEKGMKSSDLVAGGFSDDAIKALWDTVLPFAGYAFNKSHAAAYGLITYWTAYLKANYPAEYMAALLTANADKKDKSAVYLAECRRMGLKVLQPDVNGSQVQFSATDGHIRFGLGAIRNVGAGVAETIIRDREKKGRFTNFADFLTKTSQTVCTKRVVESLVKAGAFDELGHTRKALFSVHEEAVEAMSALKRREAEGQFDLFGSAPQPMEETSPLAHLKYDPEEWPRKILLSFEREMLGLYVTAHPLDGAEHLLRKWAPKPIATLVHDAPKEGEIVIAGMISSVERRVNKKGEPWAICTIEDLDASIEVLFFAKAYSVNVEYLTPDSAVAVKGRVNWRDDAMSVFGSVAEPIDVSSAEHNPSTGPLPFVLQVSADSITQETVSELRSALAAHKGDTPVHLVLCGATETTFALDRFSVDASSALMGELKGIKGVRVQR
ncbi:DNA polymerase III subunit alpha [Saccharomonospora xinjiangensis]|uniref:DNA polymerase III subunit alpha n=1 Tax=Saccharomonospora xinjiangensis TaxID=75294 RepID=UPI00106F6A4A|nr:DNA polymerase III subunit alpha [Saccharomonospora xinjiangensis]QBQ60462.1 DNA polymerase III subunit alpha [Saccharomonospora xinjiangensis]